MADPDRNHSQAAKPSIMQTAMRRTEWAELFVERFAARPLTAECVFRSPRYLPANKEMCDHLIVLKNQGIVVSLKSQEDPEARTGEKLQNWARKAAKNGLGQACGALRSARERHFYCEHGRRGRVDFEPMSIEIKHLVVLVEVFATVRLPKVSRSLEYQGVPVTYFSPNDFLNVIDQLRAFPDIDKYLGARTQLSEEARRTIGGEKALLGYYFLHGASLEGCTDIDQAITETNQRTVELAEAIRAKSDADQHARLIETVSDQLAKRHPNYAEGLTPEMLAGFDDPGRRENYLRIQEELCDLQLSDRRLVGERFLEVIDKVKADPLRESIGYAAIWADGKPDFVYVLVSAKNISRPELLNRLGQLLISAVDYFEKSKGMVIADRDGSNFELMMIINHSTSSEVRQLGQAFFGSLKMTDHPSTLVPMGSSSES